MREEVITRLFAVLSSTRYSLAQEQVTRTLAEIGGKSVNAQLVQLLTNEQLNSHVRRRIAEALETLGADEERLFRLLLPSYVRQIWLIPYTAHSEQ